MKWDRDIKLHPYLTLLKKSPWRVSSKYTSHRQTLRIALRIFHGESFLQKDEERPVLMGRRLTAFPHQTLLMSGFSLRLTGRREWAPVCPLTRLKIGAEIRAEGGPPEVCTELAALAVLCS